MLYLHSWAYDDSVFCAVCYLIGDDYSPFGLPSLSFHSFFFVSYLLCLSQVCIF